MAWLVNQPPLSCGGTEPACLQLDIVRTSPPPRFWRHWRSGCAYRADAPPEAANEKPLSAAVDLLRARGGREDAGTFLPMFVRVSSELWVPPVPLYTSLAIATVRRVEQPGRQSAAVFGALGVVLTYIFAADLFRQRALGWFAALLLLFNPAYVVSARNGAIDGVWVIPPLLISLIAVTRFAETRSPRAIAVASAALAVCAYAQPSGAFLVVIVGAVVTIGLGRFRLLSVRDTWRAASAAAAVALPMALWFVVHPTTYFDTFGRWFLHQAYIRNPWLLALRLMNYFSLAEWGSIYWNFFRPDAPALQRRGAGVSRHVPDGAGCVLGRGRLRSRKAGATANNPGVRSLWIVAVGFVASPLVPASFAEPGAIQKA
jgi:4-amino-4-deoxy-L-arabinose transferase-like glycosyltransferase